MTHRVPEPDWKAFRELRERALDRLCERALLEMVAVIEKAGESSHERFLELYSLVHERNEQIAQCFDNPKRSTMLLQLGLIHRLGLVEEAELEVLSSNTRETVQSLAEFQR